VYFFFLGFEITSLEASESLSSGKGLGERFSALLDVSMSMYPAGRRMRLQGLVRMTSSRIRFPEYTAEEDEEDADDGAVEAAALS